MGLRTYFSRVFRTPLANDGCTYAKIKGKWNSLDKFRGYLWDKIR